MKKKMKMKLSHLEAELSHLSFGHTPGHHLLIRGINSPCLPFSQREEKKAFTLVELIVVITILAILGTIAFISIQSYTVYARDSVRLSNLKTIESSLKIQYTQGGSYAVPDDSVNITASGTVIRKQGVFGKQAVRTVKLNTDASEDPLTKQYYDYVVDNNLSEYQLVGYMEGEEAFNHNPLSGAKNNQVPDKGFRVINSTFANTGSTLKALGQDLGIIFENDVAIHKNSDNVGNDIEIRNSTTTEYTVLFGEGDSFTSSDGGLLFSSIYNRSTNLFKQKNLAYLDTSLELYYDMESTLTNDDGDIVIKDYSDNEIHGKCYSSGALVDCGKDLLIINGESTNGKAAVFGGDDYVLGEDVIQSGNGGMTLSFLIRPDNNAWERTVNEHIFSNGTGESGTGSIFLKARTTYGCYFYAGRCDDSPQYRNDVIFYMKKADVSGIDPLDGATRWHGRGAEWDENGWTKGEWYLITAVLHTNGGYQLYNNNVLVADNMTSHDYPLKEGPYKIPSDFLLGNILNSNQGFRGLIDEVRVYNRPLNAEEINIFYSTVFR